MHQKRQVGNLGLFAFSYFATWDQLNEATLDACPEINIPVAGEVHVDITDGDKGARASKVLNNVQHFQDYVHRHKALLKVNKATADAYTACFDATTELELSTVQTGLPPQIFGRITALPDEEQFQCKIPGGLGWCDKSTGVESHNNKPLDLLRSLHFVNFLSEAVRHFASRFRERAADVRKKHGAMLKINAQHTHPPKVWKRMHA